jgi:hypothetical protein
LSFCLPRLDHVARAEPVLLDATVPFDLLDRPVDRDGPVDPGPA